MINRIVLVGRLTRDPELRTTTTGKQVASFRIAVNRRGSQDEADFFNVVCWDQSAEFVSNFLTKGRLVGVDGRLQTRTWEDQEGRRRYEVEIIADRVSGLDRPRDVETSGEGDLGTPESEPVGAEEEYEEIDDPFRGEY